MKSWMFSIQKMKIDVPTRAKIRSLFFSPLPDWAIIHNQKPVTLALIVGLKVTRLVTGLFDVWTKLQCEKRVTKFV